MYYNIFERDKGIYMYESSDDEILSIENDIGIIENNPIGLCKAEENCFSDFIYKKCVNLEFDVNLNVYSYNPFKLISL